MSEWLQRMIAEAEAGWDWDAELTELAKVTPTERNTVQRDRWDRMAWEMMRGSVRPLNEEIERVEADHETAGPAFEDLFNLLYQGDPRFADPASVLPEFQANLDLLKALQATPEWEKLREDTTYDDYAATFALLTMEEEIRRAFERVADKREAQRQASQQQQDAEQGLAEAMAQAQQAAQDGQGEDQAAQDLAEAMAAAQQAAQSAQQATQQHQQAARDAVTGMASAASHTADDLKEEAELAASFGDGEGDLQRMPFEERRALAERLKRSRLAKFAKMFGATREFADAERRRKVKHAPAETHEYELGRDLTKVVESERLNMVVPELEDLFWLRWLRHSLLQRRVHGEKKLGKGPIIVVCDESFSMTAVDAEGNTREAWSKALSLALCDQAKRDQRDFTYIGFGSLDQQYRLDFPGGRTSIEKVLDFTEHFFAGGTHYERPLAMALEIIEAALALGKDQPDVVFITDDEYRVVGDFTEEFALARKRADAKVYGIQIGSGSVADAMRSLCDRVIPLAKVVALPEAVKDLFRTI